MECRFNNKVRCHSINEESLTLDYCQCCTLEHIANQLNVMIKQNDSLLRLIQSKE